MWSEVMIISTIVGINIHVVELFAEESIPEVKKVDQSLPASTFEFAKAR